MTRNLQIAMGPNLDNIHGYSWAVATPSGWTYDTGSPPTGALGWLKKAGTASDHFVIGSNQGAGHGFARAWIVGQFKLTEDTPGDLGTSRAGGPWNNATSGTIDFDFVGQSGGGYKVELNVSAVGIDLGSTTLSFGTVYPFRVSCNGTTVTLEVDSGAGLAEECSITSGVLWDKNRITFLSDGVSGVNVRYGTVAFYTGDDGDDRPDVDVVTTLRVPNADGTESDFGNDAGGCAAGGGTYDRWDDWATGGEDGSLLCAAGGSNEDHTSATANYTKTKDTTHLMAMCVTVAAGAGKNPDPAMRIHDGTNGSTGDAVVATTTKQGRGYAFTTDASGAAWGQTGMDNTEIGMHVSGSDNCFCYAVGLEWVEVSNDAGGDPPAAAHQRRGVAIGSANALTI